MWQQADGWLPVVARCLGAIREKRPLVHHITNEVTAEASANAVLSLGGSPVMARDAGEVEGVLEQASSLVVNLGTLTRERLAAAEKAYRFAVRIGRPVVLDPVGAGAVPGRAQAARRLLKGPAWMVVRANAAEISGILDLAAVRGRGVDVDHSGAQRDMLQQVVELAKRVAELHEVVVAVTGQVDVVTDGTRTVYLRCGHPWLTRITGAGCMASSVIGAALGAIHEPARLDSILEAAVSGLAIFGAAGAWAAEACAPEAGDGGTAPAGDTAGGQGAGDAPGDGGGAGGGGPRPLPPGIGLFRARLMDALFHLDEEELARRVVFGEEG